MKIRCLIVDDEPMAQRGLEENIREFNYLELTGTASNAMEAMKLMEKQEVDLLFLDINMPKITGLDFLRNLKKRPLVIIVSAYSEYALDGFDLDVLDYLVKPVTFNRFMKAVEKAKEYYHLQHGKTDVSAETFFFIKTGNSLEKIMYSDILFVEAADNYVYIHTPEKKYFTYVTIKMVEEKLPGKDFIRVHKSFIVPLSRITGIEGNELLMGTHRIPVSRGLKEEIMEAVVNRNLLKR
jgi:two-component system LytT family response regulator